jgi:hypothetical protein
MDWNLRIRFARRDEHEDVWGLCIHQATKKEAIILIANPRWTTDVDPDTYIADTETTIVHELAHLHFAPLDHINNSIKGRVEEVIVSTFAQLLVALDRRDESLIHPNNPTKLSKVARFTEPA